MAKWTKEQEAAITCKDKNLLVSAAAGAGKTAVLVERIMRRIVDAEKFVDVDRLISGRYMDNLEFMQWFKRFFEMNVSDKGD